MIGTVLERLMDKTSPEPNSGCWLWMGATGRLGYGQIGVDGKIKSAHRVMYELQRGPIPDGLELDHLCRVRCCINPQHLEPVSHHTNIVRSPLTIAGRHKRRTHCPSGHPYDAVNTNLRDGRRYCRTCNNEYRRLKGNGE